MVHGLGLQPHGAEVVALPEVVQGRLILRAYGVQANTEGGPGSLDPFRNQHFELAEVAERLVLETRPRVYEEVVVSKEALDRIETVTAVLRHHEAEVIVEDPAAISTVRQPNPTRA